ncbi:MAG: sortase [Clostridia bacterium]|nr:sortase [Clostridia bacterium]
MNQILVTEKLYVTPELKKKKKMYKFEFFLSIFLVCLLSSFYIYAEYDKNKNEKLSQQLLASVNIPMYEQIDDNTTIAPEKNIITVVLDGEDGEVINAQEMIEEAMKEPEKIMHTSPNGYEYYTLAVINIPKIEVNYPIICGTTGSKEETEELLKISPCKFHGVDPHKEGNFCIVGHNYRNKKFFSKVPTLELGDTVEITDLYGKTVTYEIYDKYIVDPDDVRCTSQLTNGRTEITLITCTNDSQNRWILKAVAI